MAEENVNEVLGIEETPSEPPKKYGIFDPEPESNSEETQSNAAENTLNVIATIVLWAGIIGTIFCLFTITTTKVVDPTYTYSIHYQTLFNPAGLAISIGVFVSALTTWALLRVVANISTSLKEINSKMK